MKFVEMLKKLGIKIVRPNPSVMYEKGYDQSDLNDLIYQLRKSIWSSVDKIKGRKVSFISTNDIGPDGRLYPDYLERRKQRKHKK